MGKGKISKGIFWLLTVLVIFLFFHFKFWKSESVISWDISLYYSYLPATLIYDDIKIEKPELIEALGKHHFYTYVNEDGARYVKMTMGVSFLYAPFFLLSHTWATYDPAFAADGFSLPYRIGLLASTGFFTLLGLWFLRKTLLRFFSDGATAITLVAVYLGTNLLYYSLREPMTHAYNFFLFSTILFLYFKFTDKPSFAKSLLLGLLAGLLVLIRPTNIIAFIFPLAHFFYYHRTTLFVYIKYMPVLILSAFIAILPQLLYWHYTTGHWVVYSYNNERFFFHDPEIIKGLFSYRKGWFIYSPAIIFAFIGFGFLWFKNRFFALSCFITLFIAIWVTFSWWCWWYGGGFGARPLIDFLPLVAFGFAACFEALNRSPIPIRSVFYSILGALCFFSVFYSKQYLTNIIHFDGMTKELFWKQFLIDHYIQDYEKYVDRPDYDAAIINED